MTTATLITRCKTRFGDPNNDIVSDVNWLAYLQDAYDEGNSFSPYWPFDKAQDTSVTFAAGTSTVSLETEQPDAWRILAVHNTTDHYTLYPLEGNSRPYSVFPTGSADPGSPTLYRLFNRTLEIFPVPDHAITLTIEVYKGPAALVNDSTSPAWPTEFHHVLVEGALAKAYRDDGNDAFSDKHYAAFMSGITKMEEALLSGGQNEGYPIVVDSWYD